MKMESRGGEDLQGIVTLHCCYSGRLRRVRRDNRGQESEAAPRDTALGTGEEQALSDLREGFPHLGRHRDPPGRGARREGADRHLSLVRQGAPTSKDAG